MCVLRVRKHSQINQRLIAVRNETENKKPPKIRRDLDIVTSIHCFFLLSFSRLFIYFTSFSFICINFAWHSPFAYMLKCYWFHIPSIPSRSDFIHKIKHKCACIFLTSVKTKVHKKNNVFVFFYSRNRQKTELAVDNVHGARTKETDQNHGWWGKPLKETATAKKTAKKFKISC